LEEAQLSLGGRWQPETPLEVEFASSLLRVMV
jgi:hypothetical protein